MMPNIKYAFTLLVLFLFSAPSLQAAIEVPPPKIKAAGHILVDFSSGKVLAENNADKRLEPASLTKIMTAYVLFNELKEGTIKMDDMVTISERAWRMPGSRSFVEVGKQIPLKVLLMGMVIQSGNDASVALAEHVAGTEEHFATVMNTHAKRLGMKDSHYTNATGLPHADHYTTARDLATLTLATIRDFPNYYDLYKTKSFEYNNIKQYNRNKLLWQDDSVDGVKTGHTDAAGYCLVASAKRNDVRMISVVLGTDSTKTRARESKALLNYGFHFFVTRKLYDAGQALSKVKVWKGEKSSIDLVPAEDIYVTAGRGQFNNLKPEMHIPDRIQAPIQKGQKLGEIKVMLEDQVLKVAPIVAAEDVAEGGMITKMKDSVLLWME
jgi:serine-type D-Ala-D-Ala carboxypeptidase (penicillin-binding protein 5/6)